MSFPRYPKYKNSGVEWLGEMPEHWEVWKLAHAFNVIGSGTTPKTDERKYYDEGQIPWINTGDLKDCELETCEKRITDLALADHSSLRVYPSGSLLIAMYGATIGKLGMLRFPAAVNQACCVFGGASPIHSKFMFYWFLGLRQQILSLATGGGQPNVSQDILRTIRVACPNEVEQTAIAAFLDRETAKIDALVAEQRRLIELLAEKRQAVISHAVTKGLDPHAKLKPSGIEWLGDVPEHWTPLRLGRLFKQVKRQNYADKTVLSVYRDYGVIRKDSRDDNMNKTPDDLSVYQLVNTGDLVINKMKAWQGSLGISEIEGITSPDYVVFAPTHNESTAFLHFLLRSQVMVTVYLSISNGIRLAQWRLEPSEFLNQVIFLPSLDEQIQLSGFVRNQLEKFDTLAVEAERAIELLQERRTALISAAVTGKIDVRGIVPKEAA